MLQNFTGIDNSIIEDTTNLINSYDTDKSGMISGNDSKMYFLGLKQIKQNLNNILASFDQSNPDTYLAGIFGEIRDFWKAVNAD